MRMSKKKNDATKKKGLALNDGALETAQGGMWYLYIKGPDGKFHLSPRGGALACDHRSYMNDSDYWVEGKNYKLKYYFMGIKVKKTL